MPCDPSFLTNITMFEHLNEDDQLALARVVDELDVPEGHTLFEAGDPGDSLFIVRAVKSNSLSKTRQGRRSCSPRLSPATCLASWRCSIRVRARRRRSR